MPPLFWGKPVRKLVLLLVRCVVVLRVQPHQGDLRLLGVVRAPSTEYEYA